jgi:hypothetical protein
MLVQRGGLVESGDISRLMHHHFAGEILEDKRMLEQAIASASDGDESISFSGQALPAEQSGSPRDMYPAVQQKAVLPNTTLIDHLFVRGKTGFRRFFAMAFITILAAGALALTLVYFLFPESMQSVFDLQAATQSMETVSPDVENVLEIDETLSSDGEVVSESRHKASLVTETRGNKSKSFGSVLGDYAPREKAPRGIEADGNEADGNETRGDGPSVSTPGNRASPRDGALRDGQARDNPPGKSGIASAEVKTAQILLKGLPVAATVRVGGEKTAVIGGRISVPADGQQRKMEVIAKGYLPYQRSIAPQEDGELEIRLRKKRFSDQRSNKMKKHVKKEGKPVFLDCPYCEK